MNSAAPHEATHAPHEATHLRVAACQLQATTDPVTNLQVARDAIRAAAAAGAQLVVLPEATMVAYGADLAALAEPLDGPFAQGIDEVAAQTGVCVVVGMFEPAPDGRVANTLLVTGGGVRTSYRKIHLYDAFGARESDVVAPGDQLVTFRLGGGGGVVVGLATCYDVRFCQQFRDLGRAGAQLVCVPASWGEGPGKADQWDLLVRARAMDAQAWLLGCDQAWTTPRGTHPLGVGRSAVADPLGMIRVQLGSEPGILVHDVDLAMVRRVRDLIPVVEVD